MTNEGTKNEGRRNGEVKGYIKMFIMKGDIEKETHSHSKKKEAKYRRRKLK